MLAQNFMTAEALDIPETHRQALMKTLVLLETEKLTRVEYDEYDSSTNANGRKFTGHFNMNAWNQKHSCGSVCCIGGTAELVGKVTFASFRSEPLEELFMARGRTIDRGDITPAQAAIALRSYLTTGAANWKAALVT